MSLKNLQAAFARVNDDDVRFGREAYWTYRHAMIRFSQFYRTGFVQTTEAFVALSPNNDYHGNLRSLAAVLFSAASGTPFSELTISTYRACGLRALSYVRGVASFSDTVTGPKITAFRDNILYPDASKRVTIDGHMIAVWHGRDLTMKEAASLLKSRAQYAEIEDGFRKFARKIGFSCNQLQATLWASRKRLGSISYSDQIELFSGSNRWLEVPDPMNYPPYQIELWRDWLKQRGSHVQET